MPLVKVEAIVIRTRDLSEADRIVTLYSRERGKVRAVAKGARSPRNRFSALTQVPLHGHFSVFEGRGLASLSQGELVSSFRGVREDYTKTLYALFFAELIDEMVEEGEASEPLFRLLLQSLKMVSSGDLRELPKLSMAFQLKTMALLGYEISLQRCARCGKGAASSTVFSAELGGLVCSECRDTVSDGLALSGGVTKTLGRLLSDPPERLKGLQVSVRDVASIDRVLRQFVDYRLPRPLRSRRFLEEEKFRL